MFTYLKTRGSFRSGGFNGSADPVNATATGGGNIFDSEHTQDVEAGLKYRGEVGRSAGDLQYRRLQTVDRGRAARRVSRIRTARAGRASIAVTANVPEAEVQGVEFEASILAAILAGARPLRAPTPTPSSPTATSCCSARTYSYGPVGDTPKRSGVAYVQIDFPTGSDLGEIRLRGEVYAQTRAVFLECCGLHRARHASCRAMSCSMRA